MIENIPRSVVIAVKAAAKDIACAVKGGSYCPTSTRDLTTMLEKFMMSIVAQSYPQVKSAWIDRDVDKSWIKSAEEAGMVDDETLLKAMEKKWKGILSPDDYDMVVRNNFSKFHGKKLLVLEQENPQLYKSYAEPVNVEDTAMVDDTLKHGLPNLPNPPLPTPKKEEPGEPPAKQPLMKPGEVKKTPHDEFEKGDIPPV
jgi:hypothetical protein